MASQDVAKLPFCKGADGEPTKAQLQDSYMST